MDLADELELVAALAAAFEDDGEELAGVLPTEPRPGQRVFLCAYRRGDTRSWLALDEGGEPVVSRAAVREAVSIAVLCELAEETAGGGDLSELRAQLVALRMTENTPGLGEAEEAALALEATVGAPPHVASPERLEAVGAATHRLERALGDDSSPFAQAMRDGFALVEALAAEVEEAYKRPLA